jgi:hypothetical protein
MGMTEVRVRVVNLADGSRFSKVDMIVDSGAIYSVVRYEIDDRSGAAPVVFGRRGDAPLLGVVTLEALGLSLDPLRRRLRPLRLMIA